MCTTMEEALFDLLVAFHNDIAFLGPFFDSCAATYNGGTHLTRGGHYRVGLFVSDEAVYRHLEAIQYV